MHYALPVSAVVPQRDVGGCALRYLVNGQLFYGCHQLLQDLVPNPTWQGNSEDLNKKRKSFTDVVP
jgi:hypothetical protein